MNNDEKENTLDLSWIYQDKNLTLIFNLVFPNKGQ